MKHATVSRAWRPVRAQNARRAPQGVLSALVFNICMLVLPLAGATALIVVARDHLYAYEYSEAGARVISDRVARMNGELIRLDFDRQRQWDDLVAMELMAGDISAARGFLLSGTGMLQSRSAGALNRAAARGDPAIELAALELLTPGTRARYEAIVPLLSRRAATSATQRAVAPPIAVGDAEDFELMARSLIAEPDADPLQFIMTGFSLGLAGDFSPRLAAGAVALITASRRPDFQQSFSNEIEAVFRAAAPMDAFRSAALASADGDQAGVFANSSAAFRASVNQAHANQARAVLEQIGATVEASSPAAAADLLAHATSLRDLPRLRLIAMAAGDRAAAAAKRLPRDGRLLEAARGQLTFTRELAIAVAVAALALLGLIGIVALKLFQAGRRVWLRMQDDDYSGELVNIGGNNWRPL